ncbi:MAG TPA: SPASM domain-containing protein, partial [Acidobacteriota bacterium]|nr:SPASM domain-containing protein [Acidobacteriota bacterium]
RFAELKPYCVELSIHGACDATAEALNGVPGSHTKLMRALHLLKERNIRVYLKCVVTKLVENELEAIHAIADQFGFPVTFDPVLTISDDGESYPLDLQASDEAIAKLYRTKGLNLGNSPFERKVGELNCSLAVGTIHVDPFGYVQPCVQWKKKAGNIRNQSLKEILHTSKVMEEAMKVNQEMIQLLPQLTEHHETCQHCPGLSLLRYGDAYRLEEQYLRVARIRHEVMEEEKALQAS